MAYFEDLSEYAYYGDAIRPGTRNVGWLQSGHDFKKTPPSEEVLALLWNYCKTSVVQMRGIHDCDLCPSLEGSLAIRDGETLWLGSAEIRVFSASGTIYAAPTQIYHYVAAHNYAPPAEFIEALSHHPPPNPLYYARLSELDLEWNKTSSPVQLPGRRRLF